MRGKTKYILIGVWGWLLTALCAFGQGGSISGQVFTTQGIPAAGALVRVCATTSTGIPCTPTSTIYADPALTVPLSNPTATDQYGDYSIFATPGYYIVQITVPGATYSYIVGVAGPGGSSGPIIEINSTPISPASPANFVNTASVTWAFTGGHILATSLATGNCNPSVAGYLLLSTVGGCADSTADYGVTTADTFTFPAPVDVAATALPTQINLTPDSHANATIAGAASLGVPATVTGASVLQLPAAPCTGFLEAASDTSGIMPLTCGSPASTTIQVNGTPITTQSPANFENRSNVTVTNPSAGNIQISAITSAGLEPLVNAPISGQYVVLYPTTGVITADPVMDGIIGPSSGRLAWVCSGILCTVAGQAKAYWTGFSLPSYIDPANVTAVYSDAVSSVQTLYTQIPSGGENTTNLGCTGSSNPLLTAFPPTNPYASTEVTQPSTITGSTISSVTCNLQLGASAATTSGELVTVSAVRLIVYYTGTAPPADNNTYIVPPLQYLPAAAELQIDPNATFNGLDLIATIVADLPIIPIDADLMELVNDGATKTDCSTGSGSSLVLCYWNGSSWTAYANGTTAQISSTFVGVPGNSQIILYVPMTAALNVPASCAGSYFDAAVAATSTAVFTITDITTSTTLCSATFAASSAVATFSGTGGSIAAGDLIEIVGPTTADVTLETLGVSIAANR